MLSSAHHLLLTYTYTPPVRRPLQGRPGALLDPARPGAQIMSAFTQHNDYREIRLPLWLKKHFLLMFSLQRAHMNLARLFFEPSTLGQRLEAMHSRRENLPKLRTAESRLYLPVIGTSLRPIHLPNEHVAHVAEELGASSRFLQNNPLGAIHRF